MVKVACFDLEGPLSPQDNAFEVMGLVENGHILFEAISRYDDLLALENRPDYEPGDTLALILPFLLHHNLTEDAIRQVSAKAILVSGADKLISGLKETGWMVYIISTSYEQHAKNIGEQLGVEESNIHCTKFPLSQYYDKLEGMDMAIIAEVEEELLKLQPVEGKDGPLKELLDKFYWDTLSNTPLGDIILNLNVVGGERKVTAARTVAESNSCPLGDLMVVGDSITDFKMLKAVHESGGLAVAFNANAYAVPYATIALASESLNDLRPIFDAWSTGGRTGALSELENLMARPTEERKYYFHNLEGRTEYDDILEIHKKYRSLVRGNAAKLG